MSIFAVQRNVAGAEVADLGAVIAAVRAVAIAMTASDQPVTVLHSIYVAADRTCVSVIEADDAATVIEALRRAGSRSARVLPAIAL